MSAKCQKPLNVETIVLAREHLEVDPSSPSGLRWKSHRAKNCRNYVGKPAGCKRGKGYWQVVIAGRKIKAHRLVWFLETGVDPAQYQLTVDHINRNPSDNRMDNLRMATNSEQIRNQGERSYHTKPGYKVGSSGYRWVTARRTGGKGQFRYKGEMISCGTYKTPEEAYQAVVAKREEMGLM